MTSKRSHHLIKLLKLIGVSLAYNVTHLMVDLNVKLLKNGVTHLREKGNVRFYISARALWP